MLTALIVLGIIAGYITAIPLFARAFYIMMADKPKSLRFTGGGEALTIASLWPIMLWVVLIVWITVAPDRADRRSIRTWVERPTPSQQRAERRNAAEREQRRLLDLARAEGLPVDVSERL